MDVSIFIETTFDDGETKRRNIGRLRRAPDELGVGKTWGSGCGPAVCAGQPSIENGRPHDGNVMGAFG
jgi:hypothetical protein